MTDRPLSTAWVLLTMGDRQAELNAAVASIRSADPGSRVIVVVNTSDDVDLSAVQADETVRPGRNLGIPGGRQVGLEVSAADVVLFLDDDARLVRFDPDDIRRRFVDDPSLAVVSFRLVDGSGSTSRRHVPRMGRRGVEVEGPVATFLGGACAVRASAYADAGGFWSDLQYGHEELDLAWRLIDLGWTVRYVPTHQVFHPRTSVGRHPSGWERTGRNRVLVARRDLPVPILVVHVLGWLVVGAVRADGRGSSAAYVRGWWSGWSHPVARRPMSWRTCWKLTRWGRPPLI